PAAPPAGGTALAAARRGRLADATPALAGPAIYLGGGGTEPDDALPFLGAAAGKGDLVILTASSPTAEELVKGGGKGTDAWDGEQCPDATCAGKWNSVQMFRLAAHATPTCAHDSSNWKKGDWDVYDAALAAIARAEAVFFTGGNQHDYVDWPCALHQAV